MSDTDDVGARADAPGAMPCGHGAEQVVSAHSGNAPSRGADDELIYQALRFYFWAAGQGISPVESGDALEPEEGFWQYSLRNNDEKWETVADRYRCLSHATASREYLLLASYCGGDKGADCTDRKPCSECLAMCNVFKVADLEPCYLRQLGKVS